MPFNFLKSISFFVVVVCSFAAWMKWARIVERSKYITAIHMYTQHTHTDDNVCDTVSSSVKMDWPQNSNYINTHVFVLFCFVEIYMSACERSILCRPHWNKAKHKINDIIIVNFVYFGLEHWYAFVCACLVFFCVSLCFGDNRMR